MPPKKKEVAIPVAKPPVKLFPLPLIARHEKYLYQGSGESGEVDSMQIVQDKLIVCRKGANGIGIWTRALTLEKEVDNIDPCVSCISAFSIAVLPEPEPEVTEEPEAAASPRGKKGGPTGKDAKKGAPKAETKPKPDAKAAKSDAKAAAKDKKGKKPGEEEGPPPELPRVWKYVGAGADGSIVVFNGDSWQREHRVENAHAGTVTSLAIHARAFSTAVLRGEDPSTAPTPSRPSTAASTSRPTTPASPRGAVSPRTPRAADDGSGEPRLPEFTVEPLVVSAGRDGLIKVWHARAWECLHVLTLHLEAVTSMAIWLPPPPPPPPPAEIEPPVGRKGADAKDAVKTKKGPKGKEPEPVPEPPKPAVVIRPPLQFLATASLDRTIRLWDVNTWRCLANLEGHNASVMAVTVFPSGTLASGGADGRLRLWTQLKPVAAEASPADAAVAQGNGGNAPLSPVAAPVPAHTTLTPEAAAEGNGLPAVREIDPWVCEACLSRDERTPPGQSIPGIWSVCEAGENILCGASDGAVDVWDKSLGTWACRRSISEHTGAVTSLLTLEDRILTGSWDKTVRVLRA